MSDSITLRPLAISDTEDVVKWRNEDSVRCNMIDRRMISSASHLKYFHERIETGKVRQFVIMAQGRGIGCVFLRDVDLVAKTAEFGIFIGEPDCYSRGYGTAAGRLILHYGFCELGLDSIILRVLKQNKAAIRSYEKLGFKYEKEETVLINQASETVVFMKVVKGEI